MVPIYFACKWKIWAYATFVCFSNTELNDLVISSIVAFMCVLFKEELKVFHIWPPWTFSPFYTHTGCTLFVLGLSIPQGLVHSMLSAPPVSSVHLWIWLFSNVFDWACRQARYELDNLLKASLVTTCINLQFYDGICLQNTLFPFCQRYIVKINHTVLFPIVLLLHLIWSLDL